MQSMPPPHSMQPQGGKHPPRALRRLAAPPRPVEAPVKLAPAGAPRAAEPPSQAIARLVGPVIMTIGIGMLANQSTYQLMAAQFLAGYPFIYFSGILALVAGLAILNKHPQWTSDWRSSITAVGWVLTCGGSFRIIAPQFANFIARAAVANTFFFNGAGVFLLALGGFITFKGYE